MGRFRQIKVSERISSLVFSGLVSRGTGNFGRGILFHNRNRRPYLAFGTAIDIFRYGRNRGLQFQSCSSSDMYSTHLHVCPDEVASSGRCEMARGPKMELYQLSTWKLRRYFETLSSPTPCERDLDMSVSPPKVIWYNRRPSCGGPFHERGRR